LAPGQTTMLPFEVTAASITNCPFNFTVSFYNLDRKLT
jgi:hypothetical protein